MKVVIFGGSGFLGSHVADRMTECGYEVSIFDLKESPYRQESQTMIVGDIMNVAQVDAAVRGCDAVYDFAGIADLDSASTKPVDTVRYNVEGTCNIMDACVERGVKRFVYASSFYANSGKGGFYRCSKQAAELYIEEYQRKYGLDYTILRYGSLYGPRASGENGILHMLTSALKEGKIHYSGTGEEVREYIHVKDAAVLTEQILHPEYANKHIVLTGHDAYKIKDIIKVMEEILQRKLDVEYSNAPSELHYQVTPYTYKPQGNYKLVTNLYHDIGQGLIECLNEIEEEQTDEI